MARASGSYPAGRWFKSDRRYHLRPVGQAVKTPPFHGGNMGSIPVRVTRKIKGTCESKCFFLFNDVCLWQMMLTSSMMTAMPKDVCLRHMTANIASLREKRATSSCGALHHIAIGDASFHIAWQYFICSIWLIFGKKSFTIGKQPPVFRQNPLIGSVRITTEDPET